MKLHRVLKKVHMYLGLLSMSILLVWGIVGMYSMIAGPDEGRARNVTAQWTVPYAPPPNSTDRQVADAAYALVNAPLAGPIPDYALQRDAQGRLLLNFYSVNGLLRVTVREKEGTLLAEQMRNNFGRFLDNLHTSTWNYKPPQWQMSVWSAYVEFSIWSLLAMAMSGVMMWLLTRAWHRLAWASAALGAAAFVLLYVMVR